MSGFVVRGKHFNTNAPMWLAYEPTGEHVVVPRVSQRAVFQALASAIQAWCDAQVMCTDVRIFTVADDGTETPLPTYEEALKEIEGAHAYFDGMPVPKRGRYPSLAARAQDVCDFVVRHETGKTREAIRERDEALTEVERLRGIIVAFAEEASIRGDAGGWCNLTAPTAAFDALRREMP